MNKLIIGTRSSNLALTQTKFVIKKLKEIDPTIDFAVSYTHLTLPTKA